MMDFFVFELRRSKVVTFFDDGSPPERITGSAPTELGQRPNANQELPALRNLMPALPLGLAKRKSERRRTIIFKSFWIARLPSP